MATLVIKKELCKQFRRKKLLILAIIIIVFAVCAFKVTKKFKHLHRELKDLQQNRDYISNDRFEAYKNIMERRMIYLDSRISDLVNSRSPSQSKLDEAHALITRQRLELNALSDQVKRLQQSQASPRSDSAHTTESIEVLKAQVRMLSNTLQQYKIENDALKRDYQKILASAPQKDLEQDFKTATENKLSELVNADYEHQQTFKDVKKAVEACAKQASLIALEAYIDDKLGAQVGKASGNMNPADQDDLRKLKNELTRMNYRNDETKVALTKLELDQKMNNQRVTALEAKQQEDELIKKSINDVNYLLEKFLQDPQFLMGQYNRPDYLKTFEKIFEPQFGNNSRRRMNREPGLHKRFDHKRPSYENMEPVKTFEKIASQNINSMKNNQFASKTPEELIALMDQLLAAN